MNLELTSLEKETIWNLLSKYDSYVDKGYTEYTKLTKSLSSVLKGDFESSDLILIGSFTANNTMNKVDSDRLDKVLGAEIDNLYFMLS